MSRQIIKIYVASSSDLTEERRLLVEVLDQLNQSRAAEQNVVFELTSSDYSPQGQAGIRRGAKIARADLFVLILGKNWEQSSSIPVEREFRFAQQALQHNRRPGMLLYFRSVSPAMMADPGTQLQKVISLRNEIEVAKTHPFALYDRPLQWRDLFLTQLTQWLDSQPRSTEHLQQLLTPSVVPLPWLYSRLRRELRLRISRRQRDALEYGIDAFRLIGDGRFTAAEQHFSKGLELNENPELLHSFGVFLYQLRSFDRAEKIFQRLLAKSFGEEDIKPIYKSLAFTSLALVYASRASQDVDVFDSDSDRTITTLGIARVPGLERVNLKDSGYLASIMSPGTLAHGLAAVFRSRETDPFGKLVSILFQHSPPQPRIEVLQTLIHEVGKTGIRRLTESTGALSELIGQGKTVNADHASSFAPEAVQVLATHAEKRNPATIEKISRVYSTYPELIKHLGAKPLTIALSNMAEREAAAPRRLFLNYVNKDSDWRAETLRDAPYSLASELHGQWLYAESAGSRTEPQSPSGLFANSWFEDENSMAIDTQTSLKSGHSYKYCFAIERLKRLLSLSEIFVEPDVIVHGGKYRVQLEVVCPLLEMMSKRGVMRRTVTYYSGTGTNPQTFPLRPAKQGNYSLMIRVFYVRRLLFRAIFQIKVDNDAQRSLRPIEESGVSSNSAWMR